MNTTTSMNALGRTDLPGLYRKSTPTSALSVGEQAAAAATRDQWLKAGLIAVIGCMTTAVVVKAAVLMADISSVMNDTYQLLNP